MFDEQLTWWAVIALASTAGVLAIHYAVWKVLMRLLRDWPFADALYEKCHGESRAMIVVIVLMIAVSSGPLPDGFQNPVMHVLTLALIGTVAWVSTRLIQVATDVFLARYTAKVPDGLRARRVRTQVDVLRRLVVAAVLIIAAAAGLLTFDEARTLGTSLLASAGIVGVIAGVAARSTIGNLVGGLQIVFAEPIRLDDVVVVEGEWGRIEEITLTYVVIRIWDHRRLVLPTTYFVEQPFENWTRTSEEISGTVYLYTDYDIPLDALRAELSRIVEGSPLWNGKVASLQATGATEQSVELRAVVSADDSSAVWDLRCEVRERLLAFLQREYPAALPRLRADLNGHGPSAGGPNSRSFVPIGSGGPGDRETEGDPGEAGLPPG